MSYVRSIYILFLGGLQNVMPACTGRKILSCLATLRLLPKMTSHIFVELKKISDYQVRLLVYMNEIVTIILIKFISFE